MGEPYIGEIRMFVGNFPPAGWAFCNGALMPITTEIRRSRVRSRVSGVLPSWWATKKRPVL